MSLGFAKHSPKVQNALKEAQGAGIIIFAAMANHGAYKDAAWPARTAQDAIGIHSCEEMGDPSKFTPLPVSYNRNFMVVGEGIMAHKMGGGFECVEGTSFATPIAASMAAMILAFVNQQRCEDIRKRYEEEMGLEVQQLRSMWGMGNILRSISKQKGEYLWIHPELLWRDSLPVRDQTQHDREKGWTAIWTALSQGP